MKPLCSSLVVILALWAIPCMAGVPAGISCMHTTVSPPTGSLLSVGQSLDVTVSFSQPLAIRQGSWYHYNSFPGTKTLLQILNTVSAVHLVRLDDVKLNPVEAVFLTENSFQVTFDGSGIVSNSRFSLRLTENFATNDSFRAAIPPMSLISYYTPGQAPLLHTQPPYDSFCPQRVSVPLILASPTPSPTTLIRSSISSPSFLNLSFDLSQSEELFLIDTAMDEFDNTYQLQNPIPLRVSSGLPSGLISLNKLQSLTPNYEVMATQMAPFLPINMEVTRAKIQGLLDEVASSRASLTIKTGGSSRPYDSGVDSLDAAVLEQRHGNGVTYFSTITFPNSTSIQMSFAIELPRPERRWFVFWENEVSGVNCPAPNARNAWGPEYSSMYHAWGTVISDPWSHFDLGALSWSHPISAAVDGFPAAPLVLPSTLSIDDDWSAVANSFQGKRLIVPDISSNSWNSSIIDWMLISDSMFSDGVGSSCNKLDLNMFDFVHQSPTICSSPMWSCMNNQLSSFIRDPSARLSQHLAAFPLLHGTENSTGSDLSRIRIQRVDGAYSLRIGFDGLSTTKRAFIGLDLRDVSNYVKQADLQLPLPWSYSILNQTTLQFLIQTANSGQLPANFTARVTCSGMPIGSSTTLLGTGGIYQHTLNIRLSNAVPNGVVTCQPLVFVDRLPYWRDDKTFTPPPITVPLQPCGCFANSTTDAFLLVSPDSWERSVQNGETSSEHWLQPGGLLGPDPFLLNISSGWALGSDFSLITAVSLSIRTVANSTVTVYVGLECGELLASAPLERVTVSANTLTPAGFSADFRGNLHGYTANCSLRVFIEDIECSKPIGKLVEQSVQFSVPAFPCSAFLISQPSLFLSLEEWQLHQSPTDPDTRSLIQANVIQPWIPKPSGSGWQSIGLSSSEAQRETSPFDWVSMITAELINVGNATGNFSATASCSGQGVLFSAALSSFSCIAPAYGGSCALRMAFIANSSAQAFSSISCSLISEIIPPPENGDACWSPLGKVYIQEYSLSRVGSNQQSSTAPVNSRKGIFGFGVAGSNALLAVLIVLVVGAVVLAAVIVVTVAKKKLGTGKSGVLYTEEEVAHAPITQTVSMAPIGDSNTSTWTEETREGQSDGYVL